MDDREQCCWYSVLGRRPSPKNAYELWCTEYIDSHATTSPHFPSIRFSRKPKSVALSLILVYDITIKSFGVCELCRQFDDNDRSLAILVACDDSSAENDTSSEILFSKFVFCNDICAIQGRKSP